MQRLLRWILGSRCNDRSTVSGGDNVSIRQEPRYAAPSTGNSMLLNAHVGFQLLNSRTMLHLQLSFCELLLEEH